MALEMLLHKSSADTSVNHVLVENTIMSMAIKISQFCVL